MNEQFDRALRNHIRDTFDHYDDLLADDGWVKFKKQKARKKRGVIFWYSLPSGIAAALALLWIFNLTSVEPTNSNANLAKNELSELKESQAENLNNQKERTSIALNRNTSVTTAELNTKSKSTFKPTVQHFAVAERFETERIRLTAVEVHQKRPNILYAENTRSLLSVHVPINEPEKPHPLANGDYLAFNNELIKSELPQPEAVPSTGQETVKKKNSAFNFAVDANTYYSFTTAGVDNDLNMGVGVLSELKLTKRLSINSGISLNQQTTHYQGNKNAQYISQALSAPDNTQAFFVKQQPVSVPESVETSAKLVGFDIPINLKYNIPLGKAKTFITTGISSYSLLNQSYTNDISVTNYSLMSIPTTTVLRSSEKEKDTAFSNFQFARTVNFSFGILYPVSGKNSISVEPFLKYPIAGFGSQDLEIGSGGISFKLNFGK